MCLLSLTKNYSITKILLIFCSLVPSSSSIDLVIDPPKNSIYLGDTVKITCLSSVGSTIEWHRQREDVREQIGTGGRLIDSKHNERYFISPDLKQSGMKSTLVINDIGYQDSGNYYCLVDGNPKTISVSVCNPKHRYESDSVCDCIRKKSWAAPSCFEEPPTISDLKSKHKKALIALGFFFGVACVACMILGGMVIKDRYFEPQDVQRRQAATNKKPYEKHDNQGFECEMVDCFKMQQQNGPKEITVEESDNTKPKNGDVPHNSNINQSSATANLDANSSHYEATPIKNRRENLGKFSSNKEALNELSPRSLYTYAETTEQGSSVHV